MRRFSIILGEAEKDKFGKFLLKDDVVERLIKILLIPDEGRIIEEVKNFLRELETIQHDFS